MAGFQVNRFNWVRTPTFLESTATWRARRQAARESFESVNLGRPIFIQEYQLRPGHRYVIDRRLGRVVKRLQDAAKEKSAQNANALDTLV
jgi:hypothetical protein